MTEPDHIISELQRLVGVEHVVSAPEAVEIAARDTGHKRVLPKAFVYPADASEVQAIVRLGNQRKVALWPCSRGNNWGYGGANAFQEGSIIIVMERMNRVLKVDEKLAFTVIEPGVSYRQLNDHLKQHGHKLWIDCTDGTPLGSVLGNALERGIGETPYGDHFGCLCGLEVILPNGEMFQTGGSESGNLKTWHLHKWGLGPYTEGLFTQSNMGIVTKAGIWLMPEPEAFYSYVLEVKDPAKAGDVVDAFRELALHGVATTKLHMINDIVSFALLTQLRNERLSSQGHLTSNDRSRLQEKFAVSAWSCGGGIYGDARLVKAQKSALKRRLKGLGRLTFVSDRSLQVLKGLAAMSRKFPLVGNALHRVVGASVEVLESTPYVHNIMKGIPTEHFVNHAYFRHRQKRPTSDIHPARDRAGQTWFAPILPFTSDHILPYLAECEREFDRHGFEFFIAVIMTNPRAAICLMSILHDKEDENQLARANSLYETLVKNLHRNNYQQYRAGVASWERLFDDAPAFLSLNDTLKNSLDPNNILAPGKYGIGKVGRYTGRLG